MIQVDSNFDCGRLSFLFRCVEILYAMKILRKDILEKKKQVDHTKAERYILEYIEHPFILQLHFAFQTPEKLYMVLDFMQGGLTNPADRPHEINFLSRRNVLPSQERTSFRRKENAFLCL